MAYVKAIILASSREIALVAWRRHSALGAAGVASASASPASRRRRRPRVVGSPPCLENAARGIEMAALLPCLIRLLESRLKLVPSTSASVRPSPPASSARLRPGKAARRAARFIFHGELMATTFERLVVTVVTAASMAWPSWASARGVAIAGCVANVYSKCDVS